MFKHYVGCAAILSVVAITGCQATGEEYAANVYDAGQVNTKQEAKTVQILAVMPAKIKVDNAAGKKSAQAIGGILGALGGAAIGSAAENNHTAALGAGVLGGGAVGAVGAGALVKDSVLVDGVSLTYVEDGKTLNSAQVGRACEFQAGMAIVIATDTNETRIQPNASCPVEGKKT